MGGVPFSREKINAREIALSSDENRSYSLWSRELQNVLALGSADISGTPISCALSAIGAPSLAFTSGFQMALADGDAFFYFPTDPSLTVDDSPFEVLRWRSVPALSFATPDGTNARIDLVVAMPGSADTDLVSRNILVNPSLRTIAPQNVNKTSNPTTAISVVTGTPASSPLPPAVPSGKLALFEVLVPAAAPSAATFSAVPRIFRRAPFPWSTMSGVLTGCRLIWDLTVDVTSASAGVSLVGPLNQVVIDGEIIDGSALTGVPVAQDAGGNNPFASAAGASDQPYYFYVVGGRHAPQASNVLGGITPIAVVESLVPPSLANHFKPSSAITTPRGTTTIDGAVYVGIGFVAAGTTRRKPCSMTDDMTYIVGTDQPGRLSITKTGAGVEALGTLGSKPSISRKVYGQLALTAASAIADVHMHPDKGDGTGPAPTSTAIGPTNVVGVKTQVAANTAQGFVTFVFCPGNPKIWIGGSSLATSDGVQFVAIGYDHRVQRVGNW